MARVCATCLQPVAPVDECICMDEDEDSAERLRRAIREADEGKAAPWEYDGEESTDSEDA